MDPVAHLTTAVEKTATDLAGNGRRSGLRLDRPPRPDFGDYSTNAAMLLAPTMGEPPRAIQRRSSGNLITVPTVPSAATAAICFHRLQINLTVLTITDLQG